MPNSRYQEKSIRSVLSFEQWNKRLQPHLLFQLHCCHRLVCGDIIDTEGKKIPDVVKFVDCPNVDCHSEIVCLFHPLWMLSQYRHVIVDAPHAQILGFLWGEIALKIRYARSVKLICQLSADVLAEGYVFDPMAHSQRSDQTHHLVNALIFEFFGGMRLDFQYQLGVFACMPIFKILLKRCSFSPFGSL